MKRKGILNKALMTAIADMGHTEIMIIGDSGVPIARPEQRIDIAVCENVPTVQQVVKLVMDEMIYEKVVVAEEQKLYNPEHHKAICELSDRCPVDTVSHEELFNYYLPRAKYVVRTGDFMPWGNVVLVSGIDAHKWFQKPGCITPDYYEERANCEQ